MSLVTYLKKMLPDAHKRIFDFHVELTFQEIRRKIRSINNNPKFLMTYNIYNSRFALLSSLIEQALEIGQIVYVYPQTRPLAFFQDFLAIYKKILDVYQERYQKKYTLPDPDYFRSVEQECILIDQLVNIAGNL